MKNCSFYESIAYIGHKVKIKQSYINYQFTNECMLCIHNNLIKTKIKFVDQHNRPIMSPSLSV